MNTYAGCVLTSAQSPVAIRAPGGGERVEQRPRRPGREEEAGAEEQEPGERVHAVEVDPEHACGRGAVAEVEAGLRDEAGQRPRELQDADHEHPLLGQGPTAGRDGVEGARRWCWAACSVIGLRSSPNLVLVRYDRTLYLIFVRYGPEDEDGAGRAARGDRGRGDRGVRRARLPGGDDRRDRAPLRRLGPRGLRPLRIQGRPPRAPARAPPGRDALGVGRAPDRRPTRRRRGSRERSTPGSHTSSRTRTRGG